MGLKQNPEPGGFRFAPGKKITSAVDAAENKWYTGTESLG
jgi:hypothetical protein